MRNALTQAALRIADSHFLHLVTFRAGRYLLPHSLRLVRSDQVRAVEMFG